MSVCLSVCVVQLEQLQKEIQKATTIIFRQEFFFLQFYEVRACDAQILRSMEILNVHIRLLFTILQKEE